MNWSPWCSQHDVLWHPESSLLVPSDQIIFPQYFLNVVRQTLNELQHAFSLAMYSRGVRVHTGVTSSFWSFSQAVFGSRTIILSPVWMFQWAPLKTLKVLTGTFGSLEILLWPMQSVCLATIRLRRSWESPEIHLLGELLTCSILILPAVYGLHTSNSSLR